MDAPLKSTKQQLTFLIATRNAHKVHEIQSILEGPFRFLALNYFPGAPSVVEDANTFSGNATKKAVELARWLASGRVGFQELPNYVLADDSGLEVDALHGAPGIHSARFAGLDSGGSPGNSPDSENNAKLLRLLQNVPPEKRTARFRCVIALTPVSQAAPKSASPVCYVDELEMRTELFNGVCEGRLSQTPAGQGGFGYDPLFIPTGHDCSFAELGEEVKNLISHRAQALAKLKARLSTLDP
ncbi:MAG TPA: non-canonical purine NTP pyrophosphatase [Candidatus Saccharimonadales bacterium]|nr:non-canonical purine NTP pyrophosphatase [Candidatus Saccharimonadales bacterium]